jgi:hypothetical protein
LCRGRISRDRRELREASEDRGAVRSVAPLRLEHPEAVGSGIQVVNLASLKAELVQNG